MPDRGSPSRSWTSRCWGDSLAPPAPGRWETARSSCSTSARCTASAPARRGRAEKAVTPQPGGGVREAPRAGVKGHYPNHALHSAQCARRLTTGALGAGRLYSGSSASREVLMPMHYEHEFIPPAAAPGPPPPACGGHLRLRDLARPPVSGARVADDQLESRPRAQQPGAPDPVHQLLSERRSVVRGRAPLGHAAPGGRKAGRAAMERLEPGASPPGAPGGGRCRLLAGAILRTVLSDLASGAGCCTPPTLGPRWACASEGRGSRAADDLPPT